MPKISAFEVIEKCRAEIKGRKDKPKIWRIDVQLRAPTTVIFDGGDWILRPTKRRFKYREPTNHVVLCELDFTRTQPPGFRRLSFEECKHSHKTNPQPFE